MKVADLIRLTALSNWVYYLDSGIVILMVLKWQVRQQEQKKLKGGCASACMYLCESCVSANYFVTKSSQVLFFSVL